ncbi:MAG: hypothetical protein LPK00_14110 [Bacillaceae bacterium]|nr:hypothetical protein [Bacillaceae bacterium]
MLFLFGCLVILFASIISFRNLKIVNPVSKVVGIAIAFSIVATISLGQNYTQSLIPEANDGMSISNKLAYLIIGEDGWSQEVFRYVFDFSLYVSLILILVYPIVLVIESKLARKQTKIT